MAATGIRLCARHLGLTADTTQPDSDQSAWPRDSGHQRHFAALCPRRRVREGASHGREACQGGPPQNPNWGRFSARAAVGSISLPIGLAGRAWGGAQRVRLRPWARLPVARVRAIGPPRDPGHRHPLRDEPGPRPVLEKPEHTHGSHEGSRTGDASWTIRDQHLGCQYAVVSRSLGCSREESDESGTLSVGFPRSHAAR